MSEKEKSGPAGLWQGSNRLYVILAVILVVVIVVAAVLLITKGLPALRGEPTPVAQAETESAPTVVPTFTPGPTRPPTDTPPPAATPTLPPPVMSDPAEPLFDLQSAGGRPSTEWTGFFGQVLDASGQPLAGVPLILWYPDPEGNPVELVGTPDPPVVRTAEDGSYELRIADAPFAGLWTIQVLSDEGQGASKLFTFETSDDPEKGFQQIQVIWQRVR
jgi:hypothetical protein